MLFLDAGKGEVGEPNRELLSSPFFSPIFSVTPHGSHLFCLPELDLAANNRDDDDDDDDDSLNQCSSNHHVHKNRL